MVLMSLRVVANVDGLIGNNSLRVVSEEMCVITPALTVMTKSGKKLHPKDQNFKSNGMNFHILPSTISTG